MWITSSWPVGIIAAGPAAQRRGELLEPAQVGGAGQRVDQPAVAVPHLDEPELRDVTRDRRLDGVDPLLAQRLGELGLGREVPLLDEPQDRALPLEPGRHASTSRSSRSPRSASSARDRQRRREAQRRLAGGADEQVVLERGVRDRAGRPAELDREQQARAAHARRSAASKRSPIVADVGEQLVVDRLDDRAGRGAADGVAAEGRGVVAGDEAGRAPSETSSAPIGSPFASPFASVTRVGPDAGALPGEELAGAADPGLHLVEDEHRAVLVGERARLLERLAARAAARRPRPARARARSRPCRGPTASASVSGVANRTPGTSGSNGARFAGWPVIESAPIVRPWNEPSSATSSVFPVALRAHLIAASTASVPELQKNACAPPNRSDSRAARFSIGSVE